MVALDVLEALPSSCVLGMPFLSACNSVANCSRRIVAFGSLVVMCLPQQPAFTLELYSLYALCKTLRRFLCMHSAVYCNQ